MATIIADLIWMLLRELDINPVFIKSFTNLHRLGRYSQIIDASDTRSSSTSYVQPLWNLSTSCS
jgi:hypothetical protein